MQEEVMQVIDAYALIGDTTGLAEKIQSFFMQEVISETHSVLKGVVHEVWQYVFLVTYFLVSLDFDIV